jgi:hypothetical protein
LTDPAPTQKPPAAKPGEVFTAADKRRAEEEKAARKVRERVFETSIQLLTLIRAARTERQRRGEHCSDEDVAMFLAANNVQPPKDLDAVKVPESWPRAGRVSRVDHDD